MLTSHAIYRGVGVGRSEASAVGAVFLFFVRDVLGLVGGLLFSIAAGSSFDAGAKQWCAGAAFGIEGPTWDACHGLGNENYCSMALGLEYGMVLSRLVSLEQGMIIIMCCAA